MALQLGRIQHDLAVIQRAMGLHLSFGPEMLGFGLALTGVAAAGAVAHVAGDNVWFQLAPLAAILILGPAWLFVLSRRTDELAPETTRQVVLSGFTGVIVWGIGNGYFTAAFLSPSLGLTQTILIYALNLGLLLGFTVLLVRLALGSRQEHYCLGLALATLLAGTLLPILDRQYSHPLAYGFLAVGYLTSVAIQWVQLQEAAVNHAAD